MLFFLLGIKPGWKKPPVFRLFDRNFFYGGRNMVACTGKVSIMGATRFDISISLIRALRHR